MYKIGDKEYKLLYLDTNVFREFFRGKDNFGLNFLKQFFIENTDYAPCISIVNVIELRPYADIYEEFLTFFDIFPCLLVYLPYSLVENEYKVIKGAKPCVLDLEIMHISSPMFKDETLILRNHLELIFEQFGVAIETMISDLENTVKSWELQRIEAFFNSTIDKKYRIDMPYFFSKEENAVMRDVYTFTKKDTSDLSYVDFPSMRLLEFSQFQKVYIAKKALTKNDVMDVALCCFIPYMDAVVTENSMADTYKKSKRHIPQLEKLEIFTLKDIKKLISSY